MHGKIANLIGISLLMCLPLVRAQVWQSGPCPNPQTEENLQLEEYGGLWYEYASYPFIFTAFGKCITAEYGLLPNGNVSLVNTQQNIITGQKNSVTGTAKVVGPGQLSVDINVLGFTNSGGDYRVLATDYENYAVVYSCSKFKIGSLIHTDVIWILTRERQPSQKIVKKAKDIIEDRGFSLRYLKGTNQNNCL